MGNTKLLYIVKFAKTVHPHRCGEHSHCKFHKINSLWFIPTDVGNTKYDVFQDEKSAVHPHRCGEHESDISKNFLITGSSPQMWGTHTIAGFLRRARRFIPTDVGNTVSSCVSLVVDSVHPHRCGEHHYR